MRNILSIALVACSFAGVPLLTGCDDRASSTKTQTVTHPDGTTTTEKSKTTVDSNGNSASSTQRRTSP